ncbi:glycosyltransferase family 2 protein [Plectonema cf. radiosum LEGE 06105]|uniref:Glycosyltransferase family 2 protein n=1 Tax=Plectonema cf. radiosum LEGE 06105 TaxID=945769 RepID=A0A8J7F4L2_9CYAN|nr:glycosyltransferase family 2 protein [Plectonema radiosum]MBE9214083.1 glycosyltransferase family 2 protein [Plectonema cf. radiosum LEGE 06105]
MNEIAILIFYLLVSLAIFYLWLTVAFVSKLHQFPKILQEEELPIATIVLCLRGADPFLPKCLEALLNQNYPNYELQIVVDNYQDPAWEMVTQTVKNIAVKHVKINCLRVARSTCSLKCSALLQAVSELDDNCQVVALVDADTIVHSNWLRELISPLTDPQIGATTGNRWYLPQGRYWGSVIRYIWNVAAVAQMQFYRIPWGGSLAIKTEIFRQTGLLSKWEQAFNEDTMIQHILQQQGLTVKFVPSILMLNREECDLKSFFAWVKRQLLCSRLYHNSWSAIAIHGILTTVLPLTAIMLLLITYLNGEWSINGYFAGGLAIYIVTQLLCLVILEYQVRGIFQQKGETVPSVDIRTIFKVLLALPLTQIVYSLALTSAMFMRQVEWRGITYQIKGPWDIKLVKYQPYSYSEKPVDSILSL